MLTPKERQVIWFGISHVIWHLELLGAGGGQLKKTTLYNIDFGISKFLFLQTAVQTKVKSVHQKYINKKFINNEVHQQVIHRKEIHRQL